MAIPASLVSAASTTFVPNTQTCTSNPAVQHPSGSTFTVVWNHDNTFTINVTVAPTSDVQLFASSYHLTNPAYAGGCFVYDSATSPQTYDDNTQTITIAKGFTGTKTVTVVLPTTCYNEQVDLYYGQNGQPLNDTVGGRGHDNYGYIAGNIMLTSLNPACNPQPVTPVTTTTPSTPQVLGASTTQPSLVDTGLKVSMVSVLAFLTLASALFVATRRVKTEA